VKEVFQTRYLPWVWSFFLLRSCEYGLGRNRNKCPGDRIYEQYVKIGNWACFFKV